MAEIESVPSIQALIHQFDTLLMEESPSPVTEDHMERLKYCWSQLRNTLHASGMQFQGRISSVTTHGGSSTEPSNPRSITSTRAILGERTVDYQEEPNARKISLFGGLLLCSVFHFGLSAAIPHLQGPEQKLWVSIANFLISKFSFVFVSFVACRPLINKEAQTFKDLYKQSLADDAKYRSMVRVAAYLLILVGRTAILIYAITINNKKKIINFDLSCIPGLAECWTVFRELFNKKPRSTLVDLEV